MKSNNIPFKLSNYTFLFNYYLDYYYITIKILSNKSVVFDCFMSRIQIGVGIGYLQRIYYIFSKEIVIN